MTADEFHAGALSTLPAAEQLAHHEGLAHRRGGSCRAAAAAGPRHDAAVPGVLPPRHCALHCAGRRVRWRVQSVGTAATRHPGALPGVRGIHGAAAALVVGASISCLALCEHDGQLRCAQHLGSCSLQYAHLPALGAALSAVCDAMVAVAVAAGGRGCRFELASGLWDPDRLADAAAASDIVAAAVRRVSLAVAGRRAAAVSTSAPAQPSADAIVAADAAAAALIAASTARCKEECHKAIVPLLSFTTSDCR